MISASREGSARINLRLLAKVVVGLGQQGLIYADDFNRYRIILESLTEEQIVAVGTLHAVQLERRKDGQGQSANLLWPSLADKLIPEPFPTDDHLRAALTAAQGSGLVFTPATIDETGFFKISPLMEEIAQLSDFQDAVRKENTGNYESR